MDEGQGSNASQKICLPISIPLLAKATYFERLQRSGFFSKYILPPFSSCQHFLVHCCLNCWRKFNMCLQFLHLLTYRKRNILLNFCCFALCEHDSLGRGWLHNRCLMQAWLSTQVGSSSYIVSKFKTNDVQKWAEENGLDRYVSWIVLHVSVKVVSIRKKKCFCHNKHGWPCNGWHLFFFLAPAGQSSKMSLEKHFCFWKAWWQTRLSVSTATWRKKSECQSWKTWRHSAKRYKMHETQFYCKIESCLKCDHSI